MNTKIETVTTVSISLSPDLKDKIDAMVEKFNRDYPGLRAGRSSIIRSILLRWMDDGDSSAPRKSKTRNTRTKD